jgi:hypothetical protein
VRPRARLSPNSVLIQTKAALPLGNLGAHDEALAAFEHGRRRDSWGEMAADCRFGTGICHMFAGRTNTDVARLAQAKAVAADLVRRARGVTVAATLDSTPYRQPSSSA